MISRTIIASIIPDGNIPEQNNMYNSAMDRRNIIGERVRLARETVKPKITQNDLAARLQTQGLQLEQAAVSKIESGYREVTDMEVVIIAKALGVSISWLFSESDEPAK